MEDARIPRGGRESHLGWRRLALWLLMFAEAGVLLELWLLGHYEDVWQWTPLALLSAGLIASVWIARRTGPASLRAFRRLMAAHVAAGAIGVFFHLKANVEFELELLPSLGEDVAHSFGREVDRHTQRLEHIGAAALRGEGPVPVLRDRDAPRGHDQRRRRGDVEGRDGPASRPASVNDRVRVGRRDGNHRAAEHLDAARHLGGSQPLGLQRCEQAPGPYRRLAAGHDMAEGPRGLVGGQIVPTHHLGQEGNQVDGRVGHGLLLSQGVLGTGGAKR